MSALSNIIANLESGGGVYNYAQPVSMVNPTYGQYQGFVSTYGSGAVGVDNYAQTYLRAHPTATLGDFYANYVLGTGSPSSPGTATVEQLQSNNPSAYTNLVNNAGLSIATPLSDLVNSQSVTQDTLTQDQQVAQGIDPTTGQYYTDYSSGYGPFSSAEGVFGSNSPLPSTIQGPLGTTQSGPNSSATSSFWSTLWGDITNIMARSGLLVIGVVIVGIGAYSAVKGER